MQDLQSGFFAQESTQQKLAISQQQQPPQPESPLANLQESHQENLQENPHPPHQQVVVKRNTNATLETQPALNPQLVPS